MVTILIFIFSSSLRQRAASIVTSVYADNVTVGTGNRLELWKGSLLLFKRYPLLGVGTWNFQSAIEELIREKKVKEMPIRMHAHSIYLQALATRGITGFALTIGLFTALVAWGRREIRDHGGIGGYIIIVSTVLMIVGGLWEINIEINQFLAVYCLMVGLIGPYGADRTSPFITLGP
jgi:O-antigen ligase